jgi:hypothetical protein
MEAVSICRQHFQSIAVEELLKLSVYCSAKYSTDISIHLEWASNPGPESVSGRADDRPKRALDKLKNLAA